MAVLYRFDLGRTSVAYPIEDELVPVGRDPTNRIVLNERTVSRFQFLLCRLGPGYLIEDTGSMNGTHINGKRLTAPVVLRSGSWIAVGGLHLLYWNGPALNPLASADNLGTQAIAASSEKKPAALLGSRGQSSFRIRLWWRFSPHWLGFGWKVRRR